MAVDRPTFSESWYRVTSLRPRLRATVQVHRQHFRGQMWHVLQDPGANQFFRLNEAAYEFVALLDGRRTVGEVWRICTDQMGDSAPTQGEAIQLLGQLYASNLLRAELPPDAEGLLQRYKKRRLREVQGYMTNLLFIRIPLIDPDHFLDRWVGLFGKVFTAVGFVLWLGIMATGLYFLAGRAGELADRSQGIFDPSNLALLYLSMVVIKIIHEFGHGFACKRFGRRAGSGGEVHVMGVMFLIFTPLPYVDASSAWALRSKWQRAMVGAAGMFVELAIAAIAAVVWANTATGTTLHAVCYNMMFIASISTLLFNGNPLLRYDAYYILSDLLEIPNLSQRSKEYIYYLVKRWVWGVKRAKNPAHSAGERAWFLFYGVASTIYRVFILVMILAFLGDRLPEQLKFVAIILGGVSLIMWLFVPLGKFLRYLAINPELTRNRPRAVITTLLTVGAIVSVIGLMPAAEHVRLEGVVEPVQIQVIYADTDGFVREVTPSGSRVSPDDPTPLVSAINAPLDARRRKLLAAHRQLEAHKAIALDAGRTTELNFRNDQLLVSKGQIADVERQIAALHIRAPFAGQWISPNIDRAVGAFLKQGEQIGMVAGDAVRIRATADQEVIALLWERYEQGLIGDEDIEIRVKGLPDIQVAGRITRRVEVGKDRLPSAALGYAAGGSIRTDMKDPKGMKAAEKFFELLVAPDAVADAASHWDRKVPLLSGQRVILRVSLPPRPLASQWYRSILQFIEGRFKR